MTHDDLTLLLLSIRDGDASADDVARAGTLAASDDRLPEEIKPGLFDDDPLADAAGLLAVLGDDRAFADDLRAAIAAEAGTTEVVLDDAWADVGSALSAAVRAHAGEVLDLWAEISGELDIAGGLDVAGAVMDEAGEIDIAGDVMRAVRRGAVAPVEIAAPAPANTRRWLIPALAMAAAALVAVFVGPGVLDSDAVDLHFASNAEVSVDDLDYAPDTHVQLYQPDGDAPLIIWVDDEEAT